MFRVLFACALVVWAAAGAPAAEGRLALGPALILVRDVPLGRAFSLGESSGVRFHVVNHSDQPMTYQVSCGIPQTYGFSDYEKGYEPPPDPSWFRLDRELVEVGPNATAFVDLLIDIPDRPELRNRHWIVHVDAGQRSDAALGSALRLRARIMLETAVSAEAGTAEAGAGAGAIVNTPAEVPMTRGADGWRGSASVRHNGALAADFDLLRISDLHPDEPHKGHRYFQDISRMVPEPWAQPRSFHLEPGREHRLELSADAGREVPAGSERTEVLFVARRAPAGHGGPTVEIAGRRYDRMELLRLRYQPSPGSETPVNK